jgi:enoyl-CoA hydratase/carnithine racemase
MPSNVIVEVNDGVARLTLNRPEKRNPLTDADIVDDIVSSLDQLQADREVSAIVLTGAGSAFSAGGDVFTMARSIDSRRAKPLDTARYYRFGIQRIPFAIERLDIPIIAAVNGPAIGAGCDLACMCDIRLASETAQFAESFVKLGLIPGDGGAWFLQRVIGLSKACELTFSGDTIDAQQALAMGLVSAVYPATELPERADELAHRIARNPPDAVRAAKRLIKFARHSSLGDTLELAASAQALAHTSDDHRRAVEELTARLRSRNVEN